MLDLEAQEDDSFLGQPKMNCGALTCTKKYVQFTLGEGVEDRCHVVALSPIREYLTGLKSFVLAADPNITRRNLLILQ